MDETMLSDRREAVIMIPARLESSRLPGKLLLNSTGKPLIQHTYEAASQSRLASRILVATDSKEIAQAVCAFGGNVIITSPTYQTGTDRIAEAAATIEADAIVNVQGDEPMITGAAIDLAIRALDNAEMATLATPIRSLDALHDRSCVKVVLNRFGRAIYFSRSAIPCPGDGEASLDGSTAPYLQHIGVYGYRRDLLLKLARMPRSTTSSSVIVGTSAAASAYLCSCSGGVPSGRT